MQHGKVKVTIQGQRSNNTEITIGNNFWNVRDNEFIFGMHMYRIELQILIGDMLRSRSPFKVKGQRSNYTEITLAWGACCVSQTFWFFNYEVKGQGRSQCHAIFILCMLRLFLHSISMLNYKHIGNIVKEMWPRNCFSIIRAWVQGQGHMGPNWLHDTNPYQYASTYLIW